ncbi:hypothetical protein [Deinococcus pimensis]|uniref:hypothetical protein n=1 Tax=Deinococcus pimensis TaxID=309888 RepID=UPI000484819C|nr:hypothetical protein [Deinococcus pimensis]
MTCQIPAPTNGLPCFAVLVSDAYQTTGSTAAQYDLNRSMYLVYRVVPRATVSAADRSTDPWADDTANGIYAIQEFRSVVCGPDAPGPVCTTTNRPTTIPAALSTTGGTWSLVMDDLTLDTTGGTYEPFTYATSGASKQFTLRVRAKTSTVGGARFTPATSPYQTTVLLRN